MPLLRMATITLLEEWLIHVKDVPSDQILGTLAEASNTVRSVTMSGF